MFADVFSKKNVFKKTASLATTLQKCEGYKGLYHLYGPYSHGNHMIVNSSGNKQEAGPPILCTGNVGHSGSGAMFGAL